MSIATQRRSLSQIGNDWTKNKSTGYIKTLNIDIKDKDFGNCIKEVKFDSSIGFIAYSLDGKYLFSISFIFDESCLRLRHFLRVLRDSDYSIFKEFPHYTGYQQIIPLPNNKDFIKIDNSVIIKICKIDDGCCIKEIEGHRRPIANIKISEDGKILTTIAHDGFIKRWDIDANSKTYGNCILSKGEYIDLDSDMSLPCSLEYCPNGEYLAIGYWNGNINIMECKTGNWLQTLNYDENSVSNSRRYIGFPYIVNSLSFSKCCSYLAAAYQNGTIKIWRNQAHEFLNY